MKITFDNPIEIEALVSSISTFDGVKSITKIGKNQYRISGRSFAGAIIFVKNNSVTILPEFSSGVGKRAFYFSVLMLGMILPLIAYYIFWYPKMKKFARSIQHQLQNRL
ncbi:MAG TPA: hypothetical protein PLM49_02205 [Bacteroidales bacterium]|nr:hypothetical protein [Bacteroidales bacterium]